MAVVDDAVEILRNLVGFDTTSRNSNRALIDYVAAYLRGLGVEPLIVPTEDGQKANLFATVGNAQGRGVCLSGHSDTVPVDHQPWTKNPFSLVEEDGRLYGRGTTDMKGFIAATLACVPLFIRQGGTIPFHIAISHDEELGCRGVPRLLAALQSANIIPAACVIGEPTSMQMATAHKGKRAWRCTVHGRSGHSALTHQGVNAAEYGAAIVAFLTSLGREIRQSGKKDARFDPPYTSVHTGIIRSGTALNIIPDECVIEFEMRNIPGDDCGPLFDRLTAFVERELTPPMKAVDQKARVEFEVLSSYPALDEIQAGAWLRETAAACLGQTRPLTMSYGTEGGLFQAMGVPSIVCGPGSMQQGHKADEFVTREQLAACVQFIEQLAGQVGKLDALPV